MPFPGLQACLFIFKDYLGHLARLDHLVHPDLLDREGPMDPQDLREARDQLVPLCLAALDYLVIQVSNLK